RQYLEVSTDDEEFSRYLRFRLSVIGLRLGRTDLIESNPANLPSADVVNAAVGWGVVEILRHGGLLKEAVEYAYELWRHHPDSLDAHKAVIASFGIPGGPEPCLATPETVDPGAAVQLELVNTSERVWYVIENGPAPSLASGEISSEQALAKQLIGKKKGDQFELEGTDFRGTVIEIADKHVYRLQDCLSNMHKRFPVEAGITPYKLRDLPDGQLDIGPLLRMAEERAEHEASVEQEYKKRQMPLHVYAKVLGGSAFDAVLQRAQSTG
ncbi:unnamed protein product, partial [marine sediment metagenome]